MNDSGEVSRKAREVTNRLLLWLPQELIPVFDALMEENSERLLDLTAASPKSLTTHEAGVFVAVRAMQMETPEAYVGLMSHVVIGSALVRSGITAAEQDAARKGNRDGREG